MKKFLSIPILLAATLITIPAIVPAHAQTVGLVCIAAAGTTSCPATAPTLSEPRGSTLTVAVNIQGSDLINSFGISVLADPSVLSGTSISFNGTILVSPIIVLKECVNGHAVIGPCQSTDGPGVVSVAAYAVGGLNKTGTGHLFSITYEVLATTSGISIGYQTGCTNTSNDSFCVAIGNGTATAVPENLPTATFNNSVSFGVAVRPASLTLRAGFSATSTITISSVGGFSATMTITASLSPVVKHGPTVILSQNSVSLPSGGSATDMLTVSTKAPTPAGSYTVTLTVAGGGQSDTLQIPLAITPH